MDLEAIGKKILEALAVQGKMVALETEVVTFTDDLVNANQRIQGATNHKEEAKQSKSEAEIALQKIIVSEKEAVLALEYAERELMDAKGNVSKARREVQRFGETTFKQLDSVIQRCEQDKQIIEDAKIKVSDELDVARKDFESRQKEINELGYDLNVLKPASRSKTTVL